MPKLTTVKRHGSLALDCSKAQWAVYCTTTVSPVGGVGAELPALDPKLVAPTSHAPLEGRGAPFLSLFNALMPSDERFAPAPMAMDPEESVKVTRSAFICDNVPMIPFESQEHAFFHPLIADWKFPLKLNPFVFPDCAEASK